MTRKYEKHGMCGTVEHATWRRIKNRCTNKNDKDYPDYGGRGIRVEWGSFAEFYTAMGPRPEGHSIERSNTNGNYSTGNCYWATPKQQAHNRRSTKLDERKVQLIRGLYAAKSASCGVVQFANVVAPHFGVKPATILNVVYNHQW